MLRVGLCVVGLLAFTHPAQAVEPGLQMGTHNHILRFGFHPEESPNSPPHLTWDGGPVISNVNIITVFWGSTVNYQNELNDFYTDITKSAYFDCLTEYDTTAQRIGHGKRSNSVVISNPPTGNVVDDADIQNALAYLIHSKQLPATDGDILFMVHFPPGVTITMQGTSSCQDFCAYHGTFGLDGYMTYYGVVADQGGACALGCGGGLGNQLEDTTVVASHEMIESVTDPGVGLSTGDSGWPLGWYDAANGEAGDICNAEPAQIGKWHVQLIWSNYYGQCIAEAPTSTSPTTPEPQPEPAQPAAPMWVSLP